MERGCDVRRSECASGMCHTVLDLFVVLLLFFPILMILRFSIFLLVILLFPIILVLHVCVTVTEVVLLPNAISRARLVVLRMFPVLVHSFIVSIVSIIDGAGSPPFRRSSTPWGLPLRS